MLQCSEESCHHTGRHLPTTNEINYFSNPATDFFVRVPWSSHTSARTQTLGPNSSPDHLWLVSPFLGGTYQTRMEEGEMPLGQSGGRPEKMHMKPMKGFECSNLFRLIHFCVQQQIATDINYVHIYLYIYLYILYFYAPPLEILRFLVRTEVVGQTGGDKCPETLK